MNHFNSRPSARGDLTLEKVPLISVFQFTPLREGRQDADYTDSEQKYFNSRPSARGDARLCRMRTNYIQFQFTPLREGRRARFSTSAASAIFQFTPLREGRLLAFSNIARTVDFNSRPSARGDGKRYAISANLLFNPYKSAWLNNSATQFVEIILVIFHRIIV